MNTRTVMLLITSIMLTACDRISPAPDAGDGSAISANPWVRDSVSAHVVLPQSSIDELADSIAEAQRTAGEAQVSFSKAMPHEQLRYVVLWMARTVEGSREFVWVRPVQWSPFRIEGVLVSEPTAALETGDTPGAIVSFPIEELADWVILDARKPGTVEDGAATLSAIEKRIGSPG